MSDDFGASFEQDVDDPDALRRAEDAVAGRPAPRGKGSGAAGTPIDEAWETVAAQVAPGDGAGIEDVARALEAEGVDFGWDPYDPRDAVNFGPPVTGASSLKLFNVMVPASQVVRARDVLGGEPPHGVTYRWPEPAPLAGTGATADEEFGFGPSTGTKVAATRDGIPLSDNARFARMGDGSASGTGGDAPPAGPGPSIAVMIGAVFAVVGIAVAVVAALLMKG